MYHVVSLCLDYATCGHLRYILHQLTSCEGKGAEVTLSCNISASEALDAPILLFSFAFILQSQVLEVVLFFLSAAGNTHASFCHVMSHCPTVTGNMTGQS